MVFCGSSLIGICSIKPTSYFKGYYDDYDFSRIKQKHVFDETVHFNETFDPPLHCFPVHPRDVKDITLYRWRRRETTDSPLFCQYMLAFVDFTDNTEYKGQALIDVCYSVAHATVGQLHSGIVRYNARSSSTLKDNAPQSDCPAEDEDDDSN